MRTRRLKHDWPFLYSVTERGTVLNLPPIKKRPKRKRLKRTPSADKWKQENLL